MKAVLKSLFWWVVLGVVIGVVGGAGYYSYNLVQAGYALDVVPIQTMIIEVMGLHFIALYGGGAGLALGVLDNLFFGLRSRLRRRSRRPMSDDDMKNPDGLIREARARQADEYLSGHASHSLDTVVVGEEGDAGAPDVENFITARNNLFTYRVLAYRHLTQEECMRVVRDALEHGRIQEPKAGDCTTVLTNIGRHQGNVES